MKIFKFIKIVCFVGLLILSSFAKANSLNAIPLSCISMNNQECKARPQVINVNGDEPVFFHFRTIKNVKQDHNLLMLMEMSLYFFHLVLK